MRSGCRRELGRHLRDGVRRLLPDRRGLHPLGARERHSGRPGRGSGAGSLVAYALGITDLDPLRYDLLFERFLNPERVSMPDFDIDFCMEGRDRVIDYVAERTGASASRRSSPTARWRRRRWSATSRACWDISYGFVDRIAKLIPFELGITLDDALRKGGRAAHAAISPRTRCAS